ncbi:helix-turn-helix transcriptional regulator [Streptomyces sp. NPDC002588]|uniref:helix-turn-helix domain-containing protein n=1 Tax=Streptomyces sp. NPDC002588 TaxID=3154419 RepID=UPI00332CDA3D
MLVATDRRGAGVAGEWLGRPFGAAVRTRRLELGLTQERLAQQAGMSQGALSRMEHGRGVPTLPVLERLAAALSSNLLISLSPHGGAHVVFKALPR